MCVKKGSHSNSVSSWRSVVCVSMMCLDLWGVVGDGNDDDDDDDGGAGPQIIPASAYASIKI